MINDNNDIQLLLELSKNSKEAFGTLYRMYSGMVIDFAFRIIRDKKKAEDITHDVFLDIWEKRGCLSHIRSFKPYLFKMTKNRVLNIIKQESLHQSHLDIINVSKLIEGSNVDIGDIIDINELALLIDVAVDNMPIERKTVFKLSRCKDLSYKEIAEQLNISQKTVQYHISQALRELKKIITVVSVFM